MEMLICMLYVCQVHLSDDAGMPILAQLLSFAAHEELKHRADQVRALHI